MIFKLTFDTNVAINAFEDETQKPALAKLIVAAKKLVAAQQQGILDIERNGGEIARLATGYFRERRGPWIWGVQGFSEWDVSTVFATEEEATYSYRIQEILGVSAQGDFKNLSRGEKARMMDHIQLVSHAGGKRDIFVTEDAKHILRNRDKLAQIGITVKSTEETVLYLVSKGVLLSV